MNGPLGVFPLTDLLAAKKWLKENGVNITTKNLEAFWLIFEREKKVKEVV